MSAAFIIFAFNAYDHPHQAKAESLMKSIKNDSKYPKMVLGFNPEVQWIGNEWIKA